ncbi:Beta-N-acetylhexosaminidase [Kribbella flavida DSM 17836]|uniref:beta-N-acetylhexosaminidase n=1 Tax=Kribbella flavida (strain DSM 17836 / JCM 10339 / NBRC 14399) TaxID=479435 RepID=D2PN13_KRIFD|nr:beta-N-acetylhexosaminidase [Kribbella flavida]ADB32715.1 Beta-N-acetylhexosaminidase [Kribbella flavida DSM 17836]
MTRLARPRRQVILAGLAAAALLATPFTAPSSASALPTVSQQAGAPSAPALIPKPATQHALPGQTFALQPWSVVGLESSAAESRAAKKIADGLTTQLRRSTGYRLPVLPALPGLTDVKLSTNGPASLGAEGYRLRADRSVLSVVAATPEGLYRGVTTLRQLLPAKADAKTRQAGPWRISGTSIADSPRYSYRGAMLDVSRHFFSVAEVKRYIDLASLYKLNKLHLHLSDDQGWRIQVDSWPRLTTYGGSLEVGGTPGGSYSKAEYASLVQYAADHYMTVIPEIDTPGHTNAALASYAELNCDGVAPPLYTGTSVGFSSLCVGKDLTYDFLGDVFREVAEQNPGDVLHLGGDEAHSTPHSDYLTFVPKAAALVTQQGKRVMGWQEIAETPLPAGSIAQYWGTDDARSRELARKAAAQGAQVVLSPANRAYLDMKYDASTPYGLSWAGLVSVQKSYEWNPSTLIPNLPESAIAGVEAPIWTETLDDLDKLEYMAFPRLPGIAELGWSPASALDWTSYKDRLAGQGSRWDTLSVNFFRAPEIAWR